MPFFVFMGQKTFLNLGLKALARPEGKEYNIEGKPIGGSYARKNILSVFIFCFIAAEFRLGRAGFYLHRRTTNEKQPQGFQMEKRQYTAVSFALRKNIFVHKRE